MLVWKTYFLYFLLKLFLVMAEVLTLELELSHQVKGVYPFYVFCLVF